MREVKGSKEIWMDGLIILIDKTDEHDRLIGRRIERLAK